MSLFIINLISLELGFFYGKKKIFIDEDHIIRELYKYFDSFGTWILRMCSQTALLLLFLF